jgi:hypothetical protein
MMLRRLLISQAGNRDSERCINNRKGSARQHAKLTVRYLQIIDDVLRENIDDLAVDKI